MRFALVIILSLFTTTSVFGYWIKDCSSQFHKSLQTSMVADLNPGPANAREGSFGSSRLNQYAAEYHGALYFQGNDGHLGAELWRVASGGTPTQVANLAPGGESSFPHAFLVFADRLFFAATTPATGEELFVYDGNTVAPVAETVAGSAGGAILSTALFNGRIHFTRFAAQKTALWRINAGKAEPVTVVNALPGDVYDSGANTTPFAELKGKLYFVKFKTNAAMDLYAYDGASVSKIKTLSDSPQPVSYSEELAVYEDNLFFTVIVSKPILATDELWRYDGVNAPVKVFTFPDDAVSSSQPGDFAVYNGRLYFSNGGTRSWRYDGTTVENMTDVLHGFSGTTLFPVADRMYFGGYGSAPFDQEPYLFDGTSATLVKEIMADDVPGELFSSSFPSRGVAVGGELYFFASDAEHGRELWRITSFANPELECDIVVAPVWDDWREWRVARREVIVATWRVDERGSRLVSRETVTATPDEPFRIRLGESRARRGYALASVVFDRETGRVVDHGFDVVGLPNARLRRQLQRNAAALVSRATLRDLDRGQ